MILKFFLDMQLQQLKNLKAEKQYMIAQLMYSMAKREKAKLIRFDAGAVSSADGRVYMVSFPDGSIYYFGA